MITLLGLNTQELTEIAVQWGEPAYRGQQLAHWIYRKRARSFEEMTNLPKLFRQRLQAETSLGRGEIEAQRVSQDGTVKILLRFSDGETVETVMMPHSSWDSVCISTQAGCPAGCVFCATGAVGFRRNLTAGEMVDQVLVGQEATSFIHLRNSKLASRQIRVVYMGMGEPLINYNPVLKSLYLLNKEVGIGFRHITLSTVGIVPGIRRLAQEKLQITLAVSLHAPNQELREQLIPVAKIWPLEELMEACQYYIVQTGRRITYEYLLLRGVNDQPEHARELAQLLKGQICHINLIPFNPAPTLKTFQPSREEDTLRFIKILKAQGLAVTLRSPRGRDIEAACGQLYHLRAKSDKGFVKILSHTK